MLAVRFQVPGDQAAQFERLFARFTEGVTDLSEPFAEIGHDLQRRIVPQTIDSGGGRTGRSYEKLTPKYAARKLKKWGAKPILEASGRMRRDLEGQGPERVFHVKPLQAEFGVRPGGRSAQLVNWHQAGTSRMPARPPIAITDRDRRAWNRIVARYLERVASADVP